MFLRLLVLFIGVPLIELALFMTLGKVIGIFETLAIVLVTGVLGAWLTKTQGLQTLAKFQRATQEGRLPHEEVMDGLMILVAGAVLLTPGFLTDAVGFFLLIPQTRGVVRKALGDYLKKQIQMQEGSVMDDFNPEPSPPSGRRPPEDRIIDAEIIDE